MKSWTIILLALLGWASHALADDINLVDCSGITSCTISTFRADVPELFSQVTLSLVEPFPIGENNIANVDLNGTITAITCNTTWQNLPSLSPDIQNQIRCSVDDEERSKITAHVRIFDQTTLIYPNPIQPSTLGFTYLTGTSSSAPYCVSETSPDTATACQWEQQNDSTWMIYALTEAENLIIGESSGTAGGGGVEITGDICINNSDGDEYIEPWEWGQCPHVDDNQTDQICLLDAVECIATASTPICLEGGVLNGASNRCEVEPQDITCRDMYTYNEDLDQCERDPYCEDDGVFNGGLDRCEIVVSDDCPEDYTYDPALDACTKTPNCAGTGIYDSAQDACVSEVIRACPGNYTLIGDVCTDSPICPSGTNYSGNLDRCVVSGVLSCPSGYTQQGDVCVRQPSCPTGGQYNPNTNRCEYNMCDNGVCAAEIQLEPAGIETYRSDFGECYGHDDPPCFRYDGNKKFCNYTGDLSNISQANEYTWPVFPPSNADNFFNRYPYRDIPSCYYRPDETGETPCELVAYHCDPSGTGDRQTNYYMTEETIYRCTLDNQVYSTQAECSSQCSSCSSCTGGYADIGSLCAANPSCPNGGTLNGTTDLCELAMTLECPTGSIYDDSLSLCTAQASCANGGTLNPGIDRCDITPTPICLLPYTLNGDTCRSPAVCSQGSYDQDLCRLQVSELCPGTYTYDSDAKACTANFFCFNQSDFSTTVNMCLLNAEHDCPDSYSYNPTTQVCDAHPICEAGAYREETQDCYEGENTCPYGETYTCKPYMGVNLCSPYACINVSDNETHTDNETETGVNDKEDDGLIDPGGNCLGTVYIYNGKDNRCRSWGATLYFAGCCNSDTYLMGTMDCNEDEKMLAMKKSKGLCHYVGEYDSRKMGDFTNIVTEKKKTYCCFNSKLSRIIQEQGRPQLIEFSQEGWGTPENPNCRGFNPEEFQMIDFTKVDMSEWAGDIKVRAIETIQSEIQTNIEAEALP